MTDRAVIQGSLVDVRNVNQHKCVRMLIDVPAEYAPKVMEAFGWPTMANPIPVAIAHLQEPSKQATDKPARQWGDISRAQQAGIACNEPDFRRYLALDCDGILMFDLDMAADDVRQRCGVQSRSELDRNKDAGRKWDRLYSDYQMWRAGAAA